MSKQRRKGTDFEMKILKEIQTFEPSAIRLSQKGKYDVGDLQFGSLLIECKHHKYVNQAMVAEWWKEINTEATSVGKEGLLVFRETRRATMIMFMVDGYPMPVLQYFSDWLVQQRASRL